MKNLLKFLGVAFVAVIGFSFAACGSGGGGTAVTSVTYSGTASDGNYSLVINKAGRAAAYTPQSGDRYVLTISGKGTSTGIVSSFSNDGVIKLNPSANGDDFIVIINGSTIAMILGEITFEDGGKFTSNLQPEPGSGGTVLGTYKMSFSEYGFSGSGTLTFSGGANGTFTINANMRMDGQSATGTAKGNYIVEGTKITATITSVQTSSPFFYEVGEKETFTIINANLLIDSDGEMWKK